MGTCGKASKLQFSECVVVCTRKSDSSIKIIANKVVLIFNCSIKIYNQVAIDVILLIDMY